MEIGVQRFIVMSEVTRGQVVNENNSQIDIRTYQILYKVGVYIYESESIATRNGKILEYRSEHRKVMSTRRVTQECNVGTQDRNRQE